MSWFLLLIIVAIALGIIGVAKGLTWLLVIGVVVFLIDLVAFGVGLGRRRARRPTR